MIRIVPMRVPPRPAPDPPAAMRLISAQAFDVALRTLQVLALEAEAAYGLHPDEMAHPMVRMRHCQDAREAVRLFGEANWIVSWDTNHA
ncbi:hypothetical protein [Lichenihabitans psoromatis]|uniref:hypothetical protein n=1 Tax=Lichenihabitans psoromatis TaxID=2528642 RepID=UPI00103554D0|nr:hypothetical protein [Lichenihabitans psoromatis]